MAPTFYDINTFEPLPPSGLVVHPMRPAAAARAADVAVFDAPATMPSPSPYRIATESRLDPGGPFERFVPTRDRLVAVGPVNLRVFARDLANLTDFPAPAGLRVDAPRDLIYMADVLGSVVGRRTRDLAVTVRLMPTFPRGYERRVLYADDQSVLAASIELQQMAARITHVPDITMFEWFKLGNLSKVDATNQVPEGSEVTAVTYSRTKPLLFAASAATGDPLVLAQRGHLTWLDRALKPVADVALPEGVTPIALEVDGKGRALLVAQTANGARYWAVDPGGQQLCDAALGDVLADAGPEILPAANGGAFVIAGGLVHRFDEAQAERWRARFPAGSVAVTVLDRDSALLVASGTRLMRVEPAGHVDALFDAGETLVSRPLPFEGKILLSSARRLLTVTPTH